MRFQKVTIRGLDTGIPAGMTILGLVVYNDENSARVTPEAWKKVRDTLWGKNAYPNAYVHNEQHRRYHSLI